MLQKSCNQQQIVPCGDRMLLWWFDGDGDDDLLRLLTACGRLITAVRHYSISSTNFEIVIPELSMGLLNLQVRLGRNLLHFGGLGSVGLGCGSWLGSSCSMHVDKFRPIGTWSVGHTITDTRSRLSASEVESIEMIRWELRAGLICDRGLHNCIYIGLYTAVLLICYAWCTC